MQRYMENFKKLNYINKFRGFKLDLGNMNRMCEKLDNPHKNLKFIHVAGTNGKGSVTLKLAKSLEHAGIKVGLFNSPHLFTYKERIQIDSVKINEDQLSEYIEILFKIAEDNDIPLTFFEYLTLISLQHFQKEQVEVIAWETGLGGRLDATNIVDPILSVITSIGYDHQAVLGDTLEEIAFEKAGIIKKGRPVLIGPQCGQFSVFKDKSFSLGCEFKELKYKKGSRTDFIEQNNQITQESLKLLRKKNILSKYISDKSIEYGIQQNQMCRFQQVEIDLLKKIGCKSKEVYLDVGHNKDAIQILMQKMKKIKGDKRIVIVFGTSKQKDAKGILSEMDKYSDLVYIVSPDHFRAKLIQDLENEAQGFSKVKKYGRGETLKYMMDQEISENDIVLICGSFFIMKEIRQFIGFQDEHDPEEMNERLSNDQIAKVLGK